jgi:hypothetical protein
MCITKTLSHSEKGYVAYCGKCNHIQIAFGTTAACITREQFWKFCEHIELLKKKYKQKTNEKEIWVCLNDAISLVLTSYEIYDLSKILTRAKTDFTIYVLAYEMKPCLN